MNAWYEESCPSCGSTNWINNGDEENLSDLDVDTYTCWKCKSEIRLSEGRLGLGHAPHINGSGEGDDLSHGAWVQGLEKPD